MQIAGEYITQVQQGVDGRIALRLNELGFGHWVSPVHDWQERFAGMETQLTSCTHPPTWTVLGLLGRYARTQARLTDDSIASDLATLEFTYWHARWPRWVTLGEPVRWQPLRQSFAVFEQRYAGAPQVWVSDRPAVPLPLAKDHLTGWLA